MIEHAIVCFSGGHSSALAAVEAVKKYGKHNVTLLNHNISSHVEHDDIKRFKDDISNYLDIAITYANHHDFENMTPLEICKSVSAFGIGNGQNFCTYHLKTKPFHAWLEKKCRADKDKCVIVYGFDAQEEERITRRVNIMRAAGYSCEFPLAAKERTMSAIEEIGIKRPVTYKLYRHANCIGCLKAGQRHWYCVYCHRNDIFEEAKAAERKIGYSIIKDVYLAELEEKFEQMRDKKHICPSERGNSAAFWAQVNKILPAQLSLLPCDCAF